MAMLRPSTAPSPGRIDITPEVRVLSGGTSSIVTVRDLLFNRSTSATTVTDYVFSHYPPPGRPSGVVLNSSNPAIASVVGGRANYAGNGEAVITLEHSKGTVPYRFNFSAQVASSDTFSDFVSGSLAKHCSDAILSRVDGKDPASAIRVFSEQDHQTSTYIRNTDCWVYGLDLTCASPWNSTGANRMAGVLVSPRHIVFAAHYQIGTGATVRFVSNEGAVVSRTMTSKLTHPEYTPYFPDLAVGVLDSDVPESISFAKVLPDGWESKLPAASFIGGVRVGVPSLILDQEEKALIAGLDAHQDFTTFRGPSFIGMDPYNESKIVGDSGSPAFLLIHGSPVLLTVMTFGGNGAGTSITNQKTAINLMMAQLGGGHQLTEIDLSSFPNY